MKYCLDGNMYPVIIVKKNNKNTYIRVKEDCTIYVTTNYLASKLYIQRLLDNNQDYIRSSIARRKEQEKKKEQFSYLGQVYDIVFVPTLKRMEIDGNRIYIKDKKALETWYKKETRRIFELRLNKIYNEFEESVPFPKLKIRAMKTRWGVCNKVRETITLNAKLIRYDIEKIDYVIVHELSHFIHFNHSSFFWNLVSKYAPNYKAIRSELNE